MVCHVIMKLTVHRTYVCFVFIDAPAVQMCLTLSGRWQGMVHTLPMCTNCFIPAMHGWQRFSCLSVGKSANLCTEYSQQCCIMRREIYQDTQVEWYAISYHWLRSRTIPTNELNVYSGINKNATTRSSTVRWWPWEIYVVVTRYYINRSEWDDDGRIFFIMEWSPRTASKDT